MSETFSHCVAAYCDELHREKLVMARAGEERSWTERTACSSIPPATTVIVVGSRGMHPLKKMSESVLVA